VPVDLSREVVSVADAVANQLRHRLLTGQYPAGAEMRDTELSEEFQVARPTVRVAVQMLVAEGLLVRGRGRSARVRSFTEEDSVDIYRLRTMLEVNAIHTVISERADLSELETALAHYTELPDAVSWDEVAAADIDFHRAAVRACGSPRMLRTFNEISVESRLLIAQLRPVYRGARQLADEHAELLEILKLGKIRAAQEAWRNHLAEGERYSLEMIKASRASIEEPTA
jgi:DNA-binding GntR family transcriptional regulator